VGFGLSKELCGRVIVAAYGDNFTFFPLCLEQIGDSYFGIHGSFSVRNKRSNNFPVRILEQEAFYKRKVEWFLAGICGFLEEFFGKMRFL